MVLIKNGTDTIELRPNHKDIFSLSARHLKFLKHEDVRENRRLKKAKKKKKRHNLVPQAYDEYIKSEHWDLRKKLYFSKHPKRCSICGTRYKIDLHHIVYSQRGLEKDKHLTPVCRQHHREFHHRYGSAGNMTAQWNEFKHGYQERLDFSMPKF